MDAVNSTRFGLNGRTDDDDESESGDISGNYEDIEARLQQERIEYLQSVRKRELEDAATARQMMQEEMLQIEREKVRHVMQDEELARRLQAEERQRQMRTQPTSVHGELNVFVNSSDSDSDEEHNVKRTDFHNAVYFTGDVAAAAAAERTRNDEMLARALQQSEQEAARRRVRTVSQPMGDAYLARIIQNTERVSAVRRQYVSQNTPQAATTPQRRMSLPGMTTSQAGLVSSSPGGATAQRSISATDDTSRVRNTAEDPATACTTQGAATSTAGAQGGVTSTSGAQSGAASAEAKRTKRRGSCKQQ